MEPSAVDVRPLAEPADAAPASGAAPAEAAAARPSTAEVERSFSRAMVVSGVRCTLTYVVFPFVGPAFGVVAGIGPVLGLVIGTLAIVSNIVTIRRFWAADHRWKVPYSAIAGAVLALVVVLVAQDIATLLAR